ncbi:MAG: putative periplasmic serine endoprotease DegP-like precursor [Lentisphaerae bacterium ADurb.BinA184]|nr:MAG: putative periplasmic serine endoprotease DegP-like precursor [Lentisphaerae bacterium ADurb.BinA184]
MRIIVLILAMGLPAVAARAEGPAVAAGSARLTPVVMAVQKVLPTVVNIATEQIVRVSDPFEPFFNDFFLGTPVRLQRQSVPLGSGVIVDPAGLLITNNHVVRRASNIEIRLFSGQTCPARLVAADSTHDLALLQITNLPAGTVLPAVGFARPDDALLGETVVAVGNPFGLGHSVTTGVLSAKNRSISEGTVTFNDILQTDAATNPGNSGGPLINLDGDLIGINLAIRRDAEGIGFAIPLRRIEEVVSRWLVPGKFGTGVAGFTVETTVREDTAEVVVGSVLPGGPAEEAGLKPGTRIRAVNGHPVAHALQVGQILWRLTPREKVSLDVGGPRPVAVTVREMTDEQLIRQRLALQVQELTPALQKALGLPATVQGLAISDILDGSEFALWDLRRGDIIVQIGNRPVRDLPALAALLRQIRPGDPLDVYLVATKSYGGDLYLKQFAVRAIVQ